MSTLLIRLAGPMQSWGVQSRFTERDTCLEPSKSGVIGLLCAALGRGRWEEISDLAALGLGVRVDREGVLKMDFHTAGGTRRRSEGYGVARADGSGPSKDPVVSRRYYLADADFLVGLESECEELLRELDAALACPVWPLYLGRKAFVPGGPLRLSHQPPEMPGSPEIPGLVHLPLREALCRYPWLARSRREKPPLSLRLVLDAPFGSTAEVRPDVPLSFTERRFTLRNVKTDFIPLPPELIQEDPHVSLPLAS